MIEVLKFICESLGHFVAVCIFIGWIALCIALIVCAFGFALSNYKPTIRG